MKKIKLRINKNDVYMDEGGATLPEKTHAVWQFHTNLSGLQTNILQIGADGNMYVINDEDKPHDDSGEDATIVIELDADGDVCGGEVFHHGQTKQNVINALAYLSHIYCKRMLEIAKDLIGGNLVKQSEWAANVINTKKLS